MVLVLFFYFCIMRNYLQLFSPVIVLTILLLPGCATTRYVPEGEFLLRKNTVKVVPDKVVPPSSLEPYIRQNPILQ